MYQKYIYFKILLHSLSKKQKLYKPYGIENSFGVWIWQYMSMESFFFFNFFWLCCAAWGIVVPQSGIEPMSLAVKAWSLNHWTSSDISTYFLLKYCWITMLCQLLLYSKVIQLYIYIHSFSFSIPLWFITRYWI